MAILKKDIALITACYHCGNDIEQNGILYNEKPFCCEGCKTVYTILSSGPLSDYYSLRDNPSLIKVSNTTKDYSFVDSPKLIKPFVKYHDENQTKVSFHIPAIHCSACVWLLENLAKLNKGVISSRVNFLKQEVTILISNADIKLSELIMLLSSIGYEPDLKLESLNGSAETEDKKTNTNRHSFLRLGVAFFCFGNIMLLSFPEYFAGENVESGLKQLFSWLIFGLSLPVVFYCSVPFYRSAWAGLKARKVNLDLPIVLGIFVMFFQSSYEIISQSGPGYFDTLAGLLFFMLTGRMFQDKTYQRIVFDRDYKSYLPISVIVKRGTEEKSVPISELKVEDRIIIRNNEIIPADSILFSGQASIDYSFVTGESTPVDKVTGEIIYAGGKQVGGMIEMEVVRPVEQSYLTQLWNDKAFKKEKHTTLNLFVNNMSKYFTVVVLTVAAIAFLFWVKTDLHKALYAFTSVLIITCPCALALSSPFTYGNVIRVAGKLGVYFKNTAVIENLSHIDHIIFDKTGTITDSGSSVVSYIGAELSPHELSCVAALTRQSIHPLSASIFKSLSAYYRQITPQSFNEHAGKGISGSFDQMNMLIGNYKFVELQKPQLLNETCVYVKINGTVKGYFYFKNNYREGISSLFSQLRSKHKLSILSGDNDSEQASLARWFKAEEIHFNQTPQSKLDFIANLQSKGERVMMVGDGLNDAGAIQKSDVGLVVAEHINNFVPSCEGVIEARSILNIPQFIQLSVLAKRVVIACVLVSFLYNVVGLSFAVTGTLSPLVAAILMPLSSVTVILISTLSVNLFTRTNSSTSSI